MPTATIIVALNPDNDTVTIFDGCGDPITTTIEGQGAVLAYLDRWHAEQGRKTVHQGGFEARTREESAEAERIANQVTPSGFKRQVGSL